MWETRGEESRISAAEEGRDIRILNIIVGNTSRREEDAVKEENPLGLYSLRIIQTEKSRLS